MRKLLAILFFALACSAPAASLQIIRGTITVTNAPTTNGQSLTVLFVAGSTQRIWTNDPSGNPAIFIQTNLTIAASATNLWNHLSTYPVYPSYGIDPKVSLGSNAVTIISSPGGGLILTVTGFWASVTYATQTLATPLTMPVRVPITVEASSNQTYIASTLVQNLSDLSTNSFATNSTALTNYLSRGPQAQFVAGPTVFQSGIGGTNTGLTNGVIFGARGTNLIGLNGTVHQLTNGYFTNSILDLPIATNLVNYGNAISSPGTVAGAEQFGTGATATNANSFAAGRRSIAGGDSSTALGNLAYALGQASTAVGNGSLATVGGVSGITIGESSTVSTNYGIAIGSSSTASHVEAVSIGKGVISRTSNEVTLGTSAYTVYVPGRITAASQTNSTFTGTNLWLGDMSFPAYANSALANGNNAAILLGTNYFMTVSGPSAAYTLNGFQGGRNGKEFLLEKDDSFTCTIANDSGVDPTAANRIYTGTGGDLTLTNNPGFIRFIYNSARSRWCVITKSN